MRPFGRISTLPQRPPIIRSISKPILPALPRRSIRRSDLVVEAAAANLALAEDLRSEARGKLWLTIALALVALGVTGMAVRYFQNRVAGRIRRATQVMQQLAAGHE